MATFTLGTASQATGCAKSTILRAIRAGHVSANRDERTKQWGDRSEPVGSSLVRYFDAARARPIASLLGN